VLDASKAQHKVRLVCIDPPESKQAFGTRSKQNLTDIVSGKDVAVQWDKPDRYKRIVGKVSVDETGADCAFRSCLKSLDAGLQQIWDGLAWHGTTETMSASSLRKIEGAMPRPKLRHARLRWACGAT